MQENITAPLRTEQDDIRDASSSRSQSANNDGDVPVSSDSFAEQHHVQSQHKEATCTSSACDATTLGASTVPTFSRGAVAEMSPESTSSPTQPLLTQIAHPILPPQLLPDTRSVDPHAAQLRRIGAPRFISHRGPPTITDPVTESQFYHKPTSTLFSQTKMENPHHPQPSPTQSKNPHTHSQELFISRFLPKFRLEPPTTQPQLPPQQRPTSVATSQPSHGHSQPLTTKPTSDIPALPRTQPQLSSVQPLQPSISTLDTHGEISNLMTLAPEFDVVPQLNQSEPVQLNGTQQGDPAQSAKSTNDTELSEWLKRNTSQSPMTSNDPRVTQPSWLPMVEKHDIPIVVGVGVSLAFIFITVMFYSVVQKNQPVPTNRAAQRNVGVPARNPDRRAAGRTYENRAFEDDDCVAVIEQSPYTSDTRARPPGPSLVTVQMEPAAADLHEDTQLTLDKHSVSVETYHESILDTKIDPSLEEETGCTMSQPNIQLQCAEDWTSNRGDNHSLCQDPLPPPLSLPSCSPSPSPPSRREEGLHTSLTLQSPEQCAAPLHHSLSISHGNPPLLLSHHLSLGLTTVAVDVHFYPPATASAAAGTSTGTQVNSVSHST
uniref:uncharacterized protein LOC122769232 isoform X1 n=1 Tax=Solea senegalensis TaxID=28829 RepID=UPI001CD8EF4A|nr:uncharacterized protein LOC122769232 isoform X1 [Solea senegalensis]